MDEMLISPLKFISVSVLYAHTVSVLYSTVTFVYHNSTYSQMTDLPY